MHNRSVKSYGVGSVDIDGFTERCGFAQDRRNGLGGPDVSGVLFGQSCNVGVGGEIGSRRRIAKDLVDDSCVVSLLTKAGKIVFVTEKTEFGVLSGATDGLVSPEIGGVVEDGLKIGGDLTLGHWHGVRVSRCVSCQLQFWIETIRLIY